MTHRISPVISFTVLIAVCWAICFWPARISGGQERVIWMSIAAGCSLLSGWLVWASSLLTASTKKELEMFVQMTIRVAVVICAVITVKVLKPKIGFVDFYGWLIGFYLLGLVMEVASLCRQLKKTAQTENADATPSAS